MSLYYALVPAAGSGSRMGEAQPKQYLSLAGRPLLYHALETLCAAQAVRRVFVVLSVGDKEWGRYDWEPLGPKLQPLFCGGATRSDSVRNGLRAIGGEVQALDWVLVHDAARPCLSAYHLDKLLWEVGDNDAGGILAVPVADTLKRADAGSHIAATVPREGLWQAQTPQMFHYHVLRQALDRSREVTDEASAVEALGYRPRLVASDATNLKVTWPLDLKLAEWILANREE
jgi:2-C-methyl-D-erythritol 4-phosphate cytidylyltransferase